MIIVLICISINFVEYLFIQHLAICMWETVYLVLMPCFDWVVWFYVIELYEL